MPEFDGMVVIRRNAIQYSFQVLLTVFKRRRQLKQYASELFGKSFLSYINELKGLFTGILQPKDMRDVTVGFNSKNKISRRSIVHRFKVLHLRKPVKGAV